MRVYVDPIPTSLSRGIHRVAQALKKYAPPEVEITDRLDRADLLVCHVIGPEGWDEVMQRYTGGNRYAVFQYCLRTTTHPHIIQWERFWQRADVVASYYPLFDLWSKEAGTGRISPNFLRLPLGVDCDTFQPYVVPVFLHGHKEGEKPTLLPMKSYLVGTCGYVAGTESVDLWAQAADSCKLRQFHLGPDLHLPGDVTYVQGLTDDELARGWSQCFYVSGLRRSEGFELPAYEGLACGSRPVMFDREDARHWLGDHAEYIQETDDAGIVEQLQVLARGPYRPVTEEERRWVSQTFSWQEVAKRFWDALRASNGGFSPSPR